MVPARRVAGHRALLPFEVELCQTLGISAEEYLYFQQLSEAYNGTRAKEYELAGVPDAQNGFLVPILINLVIGLALSALAALLAPKPAQNKPKTPPNLKTADKTGAKRYLQTESFNSVQDAAILGEIIPLVFARKTATTGGVRVNAMLLWSQLLSRGTGQQLKAAMLLSMGKLAEAPAFAGYAIGDQTLANYTNSKIGLYYRELGGRLAEGNRYAEGTIESDANPGDLLTVFSHRAGGWQPWFSSVRTPSTQTQFGCYAPLSNGNGYRVAYELVMTGANASQAQRDADQRKRDKIAKAFPIFAGIYHLDAADLQVGQRAGYACLESKEDEAAYPPWGLDDVNSATEDRRIDADQQLRTGDIYMAGTAMVVCTDIETEEPWDLSRRKNYGFRCIEPGHCVARDLSKPDNPPYGFVMQRVAVATVASARECDATEIGIKSTVWRRISGFPNVNSEPDDATIAGYQNQNGMITLGNISRYTTRMSFFRLEWRPLGSSQPWRDLSNGTLFFVQNNSPTPRYNYLRIEHARGQYEFRLKPYPGGAVYAWWRGRDIYELEYGYAHQYWQDGHSVVFSGRRVNLQDDALSTEDWYRKGKKGTIKKETIKVWEKTHDLYDSRNYVSTWRGSTFAYWNGALVKLGGWSIGWGSGFLSFRYRYQQGALIGQVGGWRDRQTHYRIERWEEVEKVIETHVPSENLNPFDVIADYTLYDAEETSHGDGPEHEIVYVNEHISQAAVQYDGLSYVGLRLNSTKEWSSFQQLSAYVRRGIVIERLVNDSGNPLGPDVYGPSNNFAEIAYALLTDERLGAGLVIGKKAVNRDRMQQAARWCHANGFSWDGVVAEKLNLRQWIYEQAGYCLLDFTILGGQFSLVPSFPYDTSYRMERGAQPQVKALFTDGNIRNLTVSWLSPEERQPFKAVVKWRQETDNGFPRERLLSIRLSDGQGGSDSDPEEAFDLTLFCTTAEHARLFARTALKLRKEVEHGLSFETTPQSAMGLAPGDYFRLVSEVTHTSRFNNGTIGPEGHITSTQTLADGQHNIIYWVPGTEGVRSSAVQVSNGRVGDTALWGTVFTLANSTTTKRLYKVESLSYAEEGWVTVAASHQPLTDTGSLKVLSWDDSHFVEESA